MDNPNCKDFIPYNHYIKLVLKGQYAIIRSIFVIDKPYRTILLFNMLFVHRSFNF